MSITKKGELRGRSLVLKNLKKEIDLIQGDLTSGLKLAAAFLLSEAIELTPLEFGVLRNSGFHGVARGKNRITARVGFTAKYAPYVHEMPMVNPGKDRKGKLSGKKRKGQYWGSGENKFLEKAVMRNTKTILAILKRKAKR